MITAIPAFIILYIVLSLIARGAFASIGSAVNANKGLISFY